jgi:hypothetical protein
MDILISSNYVNEHLSFGSYRAAYAYISSDIQNGNIVVGCPGFFATLPRSTAWTVNITGVLPTESVSLRLGGAQFNNCTEIRLFLTKDDEVKVRFAFSNERKTYSLDGRETGRNFKMEVLSLGRSEPPLEPETIPERYSEVMQLNSIIAVVSEVHSANPSLRF